MKIIKNAYSMFAYYDNPQSNSVLFVHPVYPLKLH